MVGQQAQHNRDAGEYQHDFLLAPAAHFKVVVDRRHLEQALAVGRLEVGDLQDNGQRFDDIDQADQQQDERHFTRKCQTRNRTAEEQRTGIAHKHLSRVEVIAQEAQQRTRECRRKDHNAHVSAAEADEPHKTIPKATNQVIYRILLFYVGSLAVLLSLYPWRNVVEGGSPFVLIFHAIDSNIVANALNLVVLTAALSVYNSCVYCNSRMLFGLAQQGNAPRALLRVNHRGIPLTALAVSAVATALCVVINYVMPGKAFALLMALVVAALVINWAMICITHLKFRRAMQRAGKVTAFQSFAYPLTNWLCLLFLAAILGVMYLTPDIRISVCLIPVWLLILAAGYLLRRKSAPAPVAALEER